MTDAPHMDARSEGNLALVHPDLCKVIRQAAQSVPFLVIHGIRTPEEEAGMVAKGASQTLHSRHLPNKQGFACAVDVAALDGGHVTWEPTHYTAINAAVQACAGACHVPVGWGGAWRTLKDLGHFELSWKAYP